MYINDINFNFYRSNQLSFEDKPDLDSEEVRAPINNTVIYNAMIHPITKMVIRGVIWYQGI